ncbi:MAG: hypothetical protein AAB607_00100 [Patescibacteria group bacterium]
MSKIKDKRLKISGYLLMEVMVAISLLTIGFLAVLSLVSNSISLNRVVSDQFTANYLAMEGIEIIKNLIDSNYLNGNPWNQGFTNDDYEVDYQSAGIETDLSRRLLFDSATGFYGYQSGNPTPFKRTLVISPNGSDEIKVNSIVKWTGRGGGNFEVNLEDKFFNWRP